MKTTTPFAAALLRTLVSAAAITGVSILPAAAQTVSFTLVNDTSQTKNVSASENGGGHFSSFIAGRYTGSFNGFNVPIWCNDLTHSVNFGSGYTANISNKLTAAPGALSSGYYQGGLSSAIGNGDYNSGVLASEALLRAAGAAWLSDTYSYANAASFSGGATGSTDLNTNLAAIQLTMWDLIQDGYTADGAGLSGGQFQVNGTDNTTYTPLVKYFEDQAWSHNSYANSRSLFVQAPNSFSGGVYSHAQNFSAAVPEPSAIAMLLGSGVVGLLLGTKRSRRARS